MEHTRRELLQILPALGLTAAAAAPGHQRGALTTDELLGASAVAGRRLGDGDVEALRRALEWNLERVRSVREMEIDEAIAPAVIFVPAKP